MTYNDKDGHRGGVPTRTLEAVEAAALAVDLAVVDGTGWLTVLVRLEITCIFFLSAASRARMLVTTTPLLALSMMEITSSSLAYS